jgi:hypothetical protein
MHNGLWKCFFVTLTVFATVFVFSAPSAGSDWAVSPRINISEEYNDNILFDREKQELDDWVTYVTPGVEGTYRTEKLSLSLDSSLGIEKYIDYDEYDTTDHNHRMALSCALSKTLGLKAGGYFREDTTLESELAEEGLLVRREDRRKFGGNLGFTYVFSTRVSISGGWTRRYTEYPDDPWYYDDRLGDTLDLAPQYVLSPKTKLFLQMEYTKTEYDTQINDSITNYNIKPSFHHEFAEDYYVSGGAGYRYTEHETVIWDEDTDGFVFDLSFHRNWKKASMTLLASRDQYSSVDLRSVERDRLTLRGTYRLGARLRTSVAATFRRNRVERGEDYDYYTLSPSVSYVLTPTIILKGYADYSEYGYEDDSDWDRERFRAGVTLDCIWPRLWRGK